ncbi:hypothetical protein B7463_g2141, partial [Scytalidium lignicola]
MGTVSMFPAVEGPVLKLSRAMTHPVQNPKANDKKRRVKKGEPFDPEELSRRLEAYLAEQKKQAERRRRAREAAAVTTAQQNHSNYVPKVAAAAFARTTTPDVMRQIHKLSKPALKQHTEALNNDDMASTHPVTNLQKHQALDQAAVEQTILSNRNQFQWNHDMEEAAEVDADRDVYKPPQRTFESDFSYLKSFQRNHAAPRPLSTGNVIWEEDDYSDSNIKSRHKHLDMKDMKGRNDWAQEEEPEADSRRIVRALVSPLLRKRDSIWILKSRKEKPLRTEKEDGSKQTDGHGSPPDGTKLGKGSFFTRFKRHSN